MPLPQTRRVSLFVVLVMVLVTAIISVNGLWQGADGEGWKRTIRSDAKGYYGYLQAIFLRHDLGHEEFDPTYVKFTPEGRTLNKYFCGTSLLMAPWFAVGHFFALQDPEAPRDGTSAYEQKAISTGGWVFLFLGLLALRSLLLGMGIRDGVVAWSMATVSMGTPLLQYAAMQPGWSHVYSFALVSLFLLAVHRLGERHSTRWLLAAAASLAMVVLIRPVNAMVVLAIPLVIGNGVRPALARLFQRSGSLVIAVLLFCVIVGLQPLLWFLQTGHWVAYGYQGEGFHWTRPEVLKVLVGFRRGLFLWTPVLLLSVVGTLHLWRTDRWRSVWSVVYWVVSTYIISAWWIWYYGGGFGSRVFIDHYPILLIPMALLLQQVSKRWWALGRGFMVLCIALNLAQLWQYHNGILHHECMDREKYAFTFLRFDDAHKDRLGGNYQAPPYHPNGMRMVLEETCGMDGPCHFWSGGNRVPWSLAFSPSTVVQFDPRTEFGILFQATTDTLPVGHALFLEVGLQRLDPWHEASLHALGVTEVRNKQDSLYFYEPFRLNPLPGKPGVWQQLEFRIPVPPLAHGDRLSFYFWNKDLRSSFLIDDVFMRVSAVNPY
jgi:hypothetical protein